jgi:hypothetical protein
MLGRLQNLESECGMSSSESLRRLSALLAGCAALLALGLAALAVNLELAVRVFAPGWNVVERLLPGRLFAALAPLGADLSVVSTAVPVLLFAFPLWHGWRRRRALQRDPAAVSHLLDPYPEHFPFFCVMLGLFGTLYGMMIGLDASGVSELAGSAPSSEGIRVALDRLLSGTATALLSSIVGMIGAFLAAQPFPALYRWASGACVDEEDGDLVAVIGQVTAELQALARAGAEARQSWGGDLPGQLLARLDRLQAAAETSALASTRLQEAMEAMARQQQQLATGLLDNLQALRQSSTQAATGIDELARHEPAHRAALAAVAQAGQATADQVGRLAADLAAQHQAALAEWKTLRETAGRQADEAGRDRAALRRALASYAGENP